MLLLDGDLTGYRTATRQAQEEHCAGAGDTFTAAMTVGLLNGLSAADAVQYAQLAADVVTAQPGTSVCTEDELADRLAAANGVPTTQDDLIRRITGHRQSGPTHRIHQRLLRCAAPRPCRLSQGSQADRGRTGGGDQQRPERTPSERQRPADQQRRRPGSGTRRAVLRGLRGRVRRRYTCVVDPAVAASTSMSRAAITPPTCFPRRPSCEAMAAKSAPSVTSPNTRPPTPLRASAHRWIASAAVRPAGRVPRAVPRPVRCRPRTTRRDCSPGRRPTRSRCRTPGSGWSRTSTRGLASGRTVRSE